MYICQLSKCESVTNHVHSTKAQAMGGCHESLETGMKWVGDRRCERGHLGTGHRLQ